MLEGVYYLSPYRCEVRRRSEWTRRPLNLCAAPSLVYVIHPFSSSSSWLNTTLLLLTSGYSDFPRRLGEKQGILYRAG